MKLILVRHSQAIDAKDWHDRVEYRPLSKTGVIRAEIFGRILEKKYRHSFEYFFTSEYTRAIQTAEILRKYLKPVHLIITDNLNPENTPLEFIKFLRKIPESKKYNLVVGHHPYLENLLALLCKKRNLEYYFKKPSMCEIETDLEKEAEILNFLSYDDIPDGIKIPIRKSEPYQEEIEELEIG